MKKIVYILSIFICFTSSFGQTSTENYRETSIYSVPTKFSPKNYADFEVTSGISDFLYNNAGSGSLTTRMADNLFEFSFSGGWSNGELKTGVIATLPINPSFDQSVNLGPMLSNGVANGFELRIDGDKLTVFSKYFVSGIATHTQKQIPNSQTYTYQYFPLTNIGVCSNGTNLGDGYVIVNGNSIVLHVALNENFSNTSSCRPKLGFIQSLNGISLPDMELGSLKNLLGEDTTYKARIKYGNILEFYSDETIPSYPSSGSLNFSLDLSFDEANRIKSINYIDGLGREKQSIAVHAGGQKEDIITAFEYDSYGRKVKENLSYAAISNNGNIRSNPVAELESFYNTPKYENTDNPFSLIQMESSPLNRILKRAAPGESWKMGNGNEIEFDYKTNTLNEVQRFEVNFINGDNETPELINNNEYYSPGELSKTVTRDENHSGISKNHTIEEFKNIEGLTVLKRSYTDTDTNNDGNPELEVPHDTYYIHDKFGNLTYVLSPKVDLNDGISAQEISELCYQYVYDNRNRIIEKNIPGKGKEHIVYNKRDFPILTQDANLKIQNKWLFSVYDEYGRIAYTGIDENNSSDRATLQNSADAAINQHVTKLDIPQNYAGTNVYYSKNAYPVSFDKVYTIHYYDNYTFDHNVTNPENVYGQTVDTNTKGLSTGSKVRVLDTNDWITTVTYYDQKARPIYVHSINTYLNTTDIIETQYDFIGNVLKTRATHQKGTNAEIVTLDTYTYDHMNRLLTHRQCIGDNTLSESCGGIDPSLTEDAVLAENVTSTTAETASKSITLLPGFQFIASSTTTFSAAIAEPDGELIVSNTFDELGQLVSKKVGNKESKPLQTVDYTYNIRGWLKQINNPDVMGNDLFAFGINYNTTTQGLNARTLYNGNISETIWKTANDNTERSYGYQYDALNRITAATSNDNYYNLSNLSYDKTGNIITLQREGAIVENPDYNNPNHFGSIDILGYNYDNGNKLLAVADSSASPLGFEDGNTGVDYTYDNNGNMIQDLNKKITSIQYNHLNLPVKVEIPEVKGEERGISYIYTATGSKIEKIIKQGGRKPNIISQYAGNYIYKNGTLQFMNHPEGYIEPDGSGGYDYIYQYKDHLGNIRLSYADDNNDGVITAATEIREEKNYYPFGLQHKGYNNTIVGRNHEYGFQEQEEQNELGLNWIQFKWRNHDPAIGRFMTIDPLTEEYMDWGPYVFSGNRVIDARELEGLEPHSVHKTLDGAAKNFGEQYNGISIRAGREVGTRFYSTTINGETTYSYTTPTMGTEGFVDPNNSEAIPDGTVQVGDGHTHGSDGNNEPFGMDENEAIQYGDNFPSDNDIDESDNSASTNSSFEADYTVTPNGTLLKYTPTGKTGDNRRSDVKKVNGASETIPSDTNSNTRKNNVSPNVTPEVLPNNVDKDDFSKQ